MSGIKQRGKQHVPPAADSPTIGAVAEILRNCRRVLCITGAGISAESGVPTYRGIGGLYNDRLTDLELPIEEVLSGEMMRRNPAVTWKYLSQIENACRGARPNRAHQILARMEQLFDSVCILTQNVDGFHQAAGSTNVIDIHGTMHHIFCPHCGYTLPDADYARLTIPPQCPECRRVMRPDVVLFGEFLPPEKTVRLAGELNRGFDIVFSIGTTSTFPYISSPVIHAAQKGVPTVEINPTETAISALVAYRIGRGAGEALQKIWERIAPGSAEPAPDASIS